MAEWDFATVKRLLPLSILKVKAGSGASQYAIVPVHGGVKQTKSGDDLVTMVKLSYDGSNSGSYVEWSVLALLIEEADWCILSDQQGREGAQADKLLVGGNAVRLHPIPSTDPIVELRIVAAGTLDSSAAAAVAVREAVGRVGAPPTMEVVQLSDPARARADIDGTMVPPGLFDGPPGDEDGVIEASSVLRVLGVYGPQPARQVAALVYAAAEGSPADGTRSERLAEWLAEWAARVSGGTTTAASASLDSAAVALMAAVRGVARAGWAWPGRRPSRPRYWR